MQRWRFGRVIGGERSEEIIATFTSDAHVLGTERASDPFLGVRGGMDGIVEKPRAVVIPEVMVFVLRAEANWELGDGRHVA